MTFSRQALEEALKWNANWKSVAHLETLHAAAQAILGGEPVEWCVVHGAPRRADWRDSCWALSVDVQLDGDCQFESQIRVGP